MVNLSKELDIQDLSHLSLAYTLAYLQDKNLTIVKNAPQVDGHWNFGRFQDNYLLKGDNQQLFSILNCPMVNDQKEAVHEQSISKNCHQQFIHFIAFFIAQGYSNLPEPNLNLAFCVNHCNTHWTTLVAQYQNIDLNAYQNLYRQYWQHRQQAQPLAKHKNTDSLTIQINDVKNYILKKLQDNTQPYRLPIACQKVNLIFHDSLGKQTQHNENLNQSAAQFIQQNAAHSLLECTQPQQGNTCGDWSVYVGFQRGLFSATPSRQHPTCEQLRFFSENITLKNAKRLLYPSDNIQLLLAKKHKTIVRKDSFDITAKTQVASPWRRQLNNSFTLSRLFTKLLFAAACTYFIYAFAPQLLMANFFSALTTCAAIAATSHFGFNRLSTWLFGEQKILLKFNEKYRVNAYGVESEAGLLTSLGFDSAYHLTLDELKNKIDLLLQTKLPNHQQRQILTCYYAKKLIQDHPNYFYTDDYLHVLQPQYVDHDTAVRLLRTKLY